MQGKTALESKLQEKEQLIGALTQRLEQAAEHLDRIHRSGGDRGLRQTGLPPELVEQHQTLVEDLQRAVQQWEDMQAGVLLGRIEKQILEVRDLVAGQVLRTPAPEPPLPDSISGFMSRAKGGANTSGGNARHAADQAAPTSGSASYESLKAGLLEAEGSQNSETSPTPGDLAGASGDDLEHANAPAPLDLDAANLDQLKEALESRDQYIAYLSRKLRISECRQIPTGDWKTLENVPDELRAQLEQYERRLEEALRQAEVELSMERARLGREASRIRGLEHQVATDRKRFELRVEDKTSNARANGNSEPEDDKSSRWLRMWGIGRNEEE